MRTAFSHGPACPQDITDLRAATNDTARLLALMPRRRLEFLRASKRRLDRLGESEDCLFVNLFVPIQKGEKEEGYRKEGERMILF